MLIPPTFPVYDSSGGYYHFSGYHEQNPVERQKLQTNKGKESLVQLYGTCRL